jgi:hypothetical protein
MFGRNNDINKVKPISYFATYLGGHPKYPGDESIGVYIHPEQLELAFKGHNITIPYTEIKNIVNVDKDKVFEGGNIALFGPFGLLMKRKVNATVIEYNEAETSEIRMVALDFWANTKYAQPIIYEKMVDARQISSLSKSSNMESNQPIISIESKLSGNTMRENHIIESNKDNDNVSNST